MLIDSEMRHYSYNVTRLPSFRLFEHIGAHEDLEVEGNESRTRKPRKSRRLGV